jgi:hypothetical protein
LREETGEGSRTEYIDYENPPALFKEDGTFNSKAYDVPDLFRFSQEVFKNNVRVYWDTRRSLFCLPTKTGKEQLDISYLAAKKGFALQDQLFVTEGGFIEKAGHILPLVEAIHQGYQQKQYQVNRKRVVPVIRTEEREGIKGQDPRTKSLYIRTWTFDPEGEFTAYQTEAEEEKHSMADSAKLDLGAPPLFKGDRSRMEAFLAHCKLLIKAQPKKFDQDEKKIAFILSYMKDGIAEQWKTQFIRDRDDEEHV